MEKQLIHTNISVRLSISDRDYNIMSLLDQGLDYDFFIRMTTLLHRTMVRCSETSHASLLLPILTIMKTIVVLAEERDVASHTSQIFQKLAHNLCKKLLISSDALRRSNSGKMQNGRNQW